MSYYDAHESLEELWFSIRKTITDYCLVLKGFINAAVSLELCKRDKIEQSKRTYLIYRKYVTNNRMNNTDKKKEFLKIFIDEKFKEKSII